MLKSCLVSIIWLLGMLSVGRCQAPDTLWFRNFGGAYSDEGWQVQETVDGRLIVVGSGMSGNFGNWDIYLIKTDSDGNMLWTRTFGGPNTDRGNAIRQTPDGGYIVAGWKRSSAQGGAEICLIKTNSYGDLLWTRTYSDYQNQEAGSIELTPDGGYVIAGWMTNMPIYEDIFIMKTDSLGNIIWRKNYGGHDSEKAWSVKNTSDGGFVIAGWSDIFPRGSDIYVIKTDQNGDTVWTRVYGTMYDDLATSILETPDHRYIVGGCVGADSYERRAALLFLGENGDSLATAILPYTEIHSVEMTSDSGLIISGSTLDTLSTAFIAKTDMNGQEIWAKIFAPGSSVSCYAYSAIQTLDSGYVFTGSTQAYPEDVVLAKMAREQTGIDDQQHSVLPERIALFQNYPNPFNPATTIRYELPEFAEVTIEIYDILGRKVATLVSGPQQAGPHRVVWDGGEYPSGIYFYRLKTNDFVETKKMLLLK